MLSWFDEPPALLRQAVAGASIFCDRIVAADGAYAFVHDAAANSPASQRKAIREEAKRCGMECKFLTPRIWEGQVAKRDAVLKAAAKGSDWVMTLDADWKITGDKKAVKAELEDLHRASYESVLVAFVEPENPDKSYEESASNIWHIQEAGIHRRFPFVYRVLEDMRYERNHWSLSGQREDGERVGFFGAAGVYAEAKQAFLHADHLFEHLCLFREPKQIIRNRRFIGLRDADVAQHGVER